MDFDTGGKTDANLGKQIPDALAAMLSDAPGFQLVDRSEISRVLAEQAASLTGLVEAEKAVKVGKLVGAQVLIVGKVFPLDRDTYVTAKLIGTETSIVKAVMAKGKPDEDIGTLLVTVADKISTTLRTQGQALLPDGAVVDPIPDLKKRLAGKKKPIVRVTVTEKHQTPLRSNIDPAVETEIRRMLIECGFTVLADDAKDRKPDITVGGEAFSEFGALIGNLIACSARVELKATDERAGKLVFTDRAVTRTADISEAIAGKSALQKGGYQLGLKLLEHFAQTLPDEKR
ncbi:CsgG/HfaB family protein [Humisphaera borealis]|uniref:Uncharacterized protein n=1 Tax=Humisphaera borealis TaxID=2807512 RepID=A0A7M2WVJ6_9BACT|nr:CsgG/HfaB family protein [Humisphaera borealis]QOV89577.1 hypothetical protein IPV69_25870 [Humisphaera borealis]